MLWFGPISKARCHRCRSGFILLMRLLLLIIHCFSGRITVERKGGISLVVVVCEPFDSVERLLHHPLRFPKLNRIL